MGLQGARVLCLFAFRARKRRSANHRARSSGELGMDCDVQPYRRGFTGRHPVLLVMHAVLRASWCITNWLYSESV
jgi:hypothetical protein